LADDWQIPVLENRWKARIIDNVSNIIILSHLSGIVKVGAVVLLRCLPLIGYEWALSWGGGGLYREDTGRSQSIRDRE